MITQKRLFILTVLLSASGGYFLRQYTAPIETSTVEKIVNRDKIVTVVRRVKNPDGTVVTDRRTEVDRNREKDIQKTVVVPKDWLVGVGSTLDRTYSAQVQRRVLGPVFLGIQINTKQELVGTISVQF